MGVYSPLFAFTFAPVELSRGFEPPPPGVQNRCSGQLSYDSIGANDGSRTHNTQVLSLRRLPNCATFAKLKWCLRRDLNPYKLISEPKSDAFANYATQARNGTGDGHRTHTVTGSRPDRSSELAYPRKNGPTGRI